MKEQLVAGRWSRPLLWLSLGALAAGLSLQKIRSFDYWWHLRTGQGPRARRLAVDPNAPDRFPPFADTPSLLDAYARQTRSRFYLGLGRPERARAIMIEAAERYPEYFVE